MEKKDPTLNNIIFYSDVSLTKKLEFFLLN